MQAQSRRRRTGRAGDADLRGRAAAGACRQQLQLAGARSGVLHAGARRRSCSETARRDRRRCLVGGGDRGVPHRTSTTRTSRRSARPAAARRCSSRSTPSSPASRSRCSAWSRTCAILATTLVRGAAAALAGALVAFAGVAFSGYLLWAQLGPIGAICQWCLGNDIVITVVAALCVARVLTEPQPA